MVFTRTLLWGFWLFFPLAPIKVWVQCVSSLKYVMKSTTKNKKSYPWFSISELMRSLFLKDLNPDNFNLIPARLDVFAPQLHHVTFQILSPCKIHNNLKPKNYNNLMSMPGILIVVMHFDRLWGAECTQKLVKILFGPFADNFASFASFFCFR